MPAETLGHYKIQGVLGEGGMGVVYRAKHVHMGKTVAVKQLLPKLSGDRDMVERFFNEARAAAAIDHPGIVEVLDVGYASDGSAYLVMECLEGQALSARIAQGAMSEAEAVETILSVAEVLAVAHEKGIIHRDLKPDNIFLTDEGQLKILDFGIAKLSADVSESTSKTKTGAMMGSPLYMSPEQCMGAGKVDARSDIYSLGCVAFELVCGRAPFTGDGVGEVLGKHMYVEAEWPKNPTPAVGDGYRHAVLRMLAKDPDDRFASMLDIAPALREGGNRNTPKSSKSRLVLAMIALLLLGTAALAFVLLNKDDASSNAATGQPIDGGAAGEDQEPTLTRESDARPRAAAGLCGKPNPGLVGDLKTDLIKEIVADEKDGVPLNSQFATSYLAASGSSPNRPDPAYTGPADPMRYTEQAFWCSYAPKNLVDGDSTTAWVEGVAGYGVGEIVMAEIAVGGGVEIWAGYGKSPALFQKNSRPKRVRVTVLQPERTQDTNHKSGSHDRLRQFISSRVVGRTEVTLRDINEYQKLPLPDAAIRMGQKQLLAIEILSVYPGDKYDDTCISEIRRR